MSTNFPTSLDSLTNPAASDTMDVVSHADQHADANDAVEALQAKVGVDSSAVTTSHDYKLSGVTGSDKAASKTGTETLTNKTFTTPKVDTINEESVGNGVTVDGLNIKDSKLNTNNSVVTANITDSAVTPEKILAGTGTSWAWQSWAGNWTDLTLGSSPQEELRYVVIGKTVIFRGSVDIGTTPTVSLSVSVTAPVTPHADYELDSPVGHHAIGVAMFEDASTGNIYPGACTLRDGEITIAAQNAAGTYLAYTSLNATIPFTWDSNDQISFYGVYEAA